MTYDGDLFESQASATARMRRLVTLDNAHGAAFYPIHLKK
jgi:hypothetical protein